MKPPVAMDGVMMKPPVMMDGGMAQVAPATKARPHRVLVFASSRS